MKNVQNLLIDLLRLEFGKSTKTTDITFDIKKVEELLNFSAKHSLTPLVLDCILNNNLVAEDNLKEECKQILLSLVFEYQKQAKELATLCAVFEENKIPHIPLKGAVLRDLYPEPYLRTSCDIDILVHPENLDYAVSVLTDKGYRFVKKYAHDVSFYSENGVHIELHYDTVEKENTFANVDSVLSKIWDYASPKKDGGFEYVLSPEMFYFYHIAHMLKHFITGGCGIRPFIDLWILNDKVVYDVDKKQEISNLGGLTRFENSAKELADVWFGAGNHNDITLKMEEYIFRGGVYGNTENYFAMKQAETGSRLKTILTRIFLKYDTIKIQYPLLQKHKWLTPIYEVKRWFRLVFKTKSRKRTLNQLLINSKLTENEKDTAKLLLDYFNV